jgi:hypothetical protein
MSLHCCNWHNCQGRKNILEQIWHYCYFLDSNIGTVTNIASLVNVNTISRYDDISPTRVLKFRSQCGHEKAGVCEQEGAKKRKRVDPCTELVLDDLVDLLFLKHNCTSTDASAPYKIVCWNQNSILWDQYFRSLQLFLPLERLICWDLHGNNVLSRRYYNCMFDRLMALLSFSLLLVQKDRRCPYDWLVALLSFSLLLI